MSASVLRLDEIRAKDAERTGSKAAKLGELAGSGFPVPPGFVIAAEACRSFLERLGVEEDLQRLEGSTPADRARCCDALQRRIVETELPGALAGAIVEAHALLIEDRPVACAVRSSATAEDLAEASFAGQHGTYYYVDAACLVQMVRRCWASLFGPEAVSYRATHGIPHASVSMAVVVQEMVPAEVSGVAFTVNPVSGDRGEIVIEASWGLGAAIVDGRVTPDRYVVERVGLGTRERRIAEKRFMVQTRLPDGGAERLVAVPQERCRQETLPPDLVRVVAGWAIKCEKHFGAPQDVEWAFAGGRFHLLQSRPITTPERVEIGRGVKGKYVLFKALAENFTDPLTPLTADLLRPLPPGARVIGGRLYFDLDYLRRILPFELSDEDMADLVYAFGHPPSALRLSLRNLPVALLALLILYLVLAVLFVRTRGMPDDFMQSYRALCRKVEADPTMGPGAAFRRLWLLPSLLDPVGNMAVLVNVSAIRFMPWMALLHWMLRRFVPAAPADAVALLCSGSEGVLSAEMGRGISDLAHEAAREPAVREIVARHEPGDALARLREEPTARGFMDSLARFLAVHGHRAVREFELRSARWEEDPAAVLGMIRSHLLAEPDPARVESTAGPRRQALEDEIRRALEMRPMERILRPRWRLVQLAARRARYYLKLRENSRFYHIMGLGSVRKKVLGVEAALRRDGRLKCKDDVFFLREHEMEDLLGRRLGWRDVEDRIRQRRMDHVRLAKATPPKTLGIELRPKPAGNAADAERLFGHSASPGHFTGTARVVLDAGADVALRPGEVLVAPFTDPAWTPLFLIAGAAVVEVGSYLSHAGTVAREFGMPCVVDVAGCTRRIQTGFQLEVDGSSGIVRILQRGSRA